MLGKLAQSKCLKSRQNWHSQSLIQVHSAPRRIENVQSRSQFKGADLLIKEEIRIAFRRNFPGSFSTHISIISYTILKYDYHIDMSYQLI